MSPQWGGSLDNCTNQVDDRSLRLRTVNCWRTTKYVIHKITEQHSSIQRNGRNALLVWDQDWDFAYELCELLTNWSLSPRGG